ncbi:hypothetical protein QWY99_22090 [Flavobacterium branchiarum]|uniref:Phage head morphogenesis domain-containing protein n=1 Tax=Flavobacterium branchiarum TaxID=1114870 RepID=A0ABV5FSL6_9FLAO|nr:hypothetical protein [Flavobacterium branchiarum]MDN3672628.1 hypothetical protein [Flavobacterium branchiarum]MDN3675728.1 hypothetical protein [Flavobacterium branchiarum]
MNGEDLNTDAVYNRTATQLIKAVNSGLGPSFDDNESRKVLKDAFTLNVEQFSYAKTLTQFHLFKDAVFNLKGQQRSFESIKKIVADTGEVFNKNYLSAEVKYVTQSSIMARKWHTMDAEYLQFSTVGDSAVRPEHRIFDKFTALKTDKIWLRLYTPLAWGCRCTIIPGIARNLSKEFDSDWANVMVNPLIKDTIFDNNAALSNVIFNDRHPYFKVKDQDKIKAPEEPKKESSINLHDYIKGNLPTDKEIKTILTKYAEFSPEDFRRGLDEVKFLKSTSYMMQHSMYHNTSTGDWASGSIITLSKHEFSSIKFNPLEEFRNGLAAIKSGKKMTFNQEYSFESLWHEILHAKTKSAPKSLSAVGTKNMETINQFCARHTYPDFMKKFGGKAIHQKEILENGYGYKSWITEFRGTLKMLNIDEKQAVKDLMPFLMQDYSTIGSKVSAYLRENTK